MPTTHDPLARVAEVREERTSTRRQLLGAAAGSALVAGGLTLPFAEPAGAQQFSSQQVRAFANPTFITINDGNNASPYPSPVLVRGMVGGITSVAVSIFGLTHTNPEDVAIMLVSPSGVAKVVMNGVGGDNNIAGVNLYISDSAAEFMPPTGPGTTLQSDSYKPTNTADTGASAGITFPIPGASGVATPIPGQNFNAFKGLGTFNPNDLNGSWRLYVRDTVQNDFWGQISGGWALGITTNIEDPIARDDRYVVKAGETLVVPAPGVLKNDVANTGGRLRVLRPVHQRSRLGELWVERSGSVRFEARRNASGVVRASYTLVAKNGLTAVGRIAIRVRS